jgi:hypothetical protein
MRDNLIREIEEITEAKASKKSSLLRRAIRKLAKLRDAGDLTRKDIDDANEMLGKKSGVEFQSDGEGGFVADLNGFLPDPPREKGRGAKRAK